MSEGPEVLVTDNPAEGQYEAHVNGELAGSLMYREREGGLVLLHTEVAEGFEGHGVGGRLVAGALDDVRARGLTVTVYCRFANAYIQRHPEYADLIAAQTQSVFDHVTIRVSDREASERFYDTVLRTLGIEQSHSGRDFTEWADFSLTQADDEDPVTRRLHVAFVAPSREHVDEFWRLGTEAGYREDGAPGPRPQYREDYYGAFLLDPDGNSAEAVHHGVLRQGGVIDHLWIRVADVGAAKQFYETVAPYAGFRLRLDTAERAGFAGVSGSFSLVAGTPTEHVHVAFPVPDNATVEAFHRAAIEAGYRDNGPPRERLIYHHGYFGAYVLDPDGNNVELVNHNR